MLVSTLVVATTILQQDRSAYQFPKENAVTRHSVRIGGKELKYTATAGRLPIANNEGVEEASMFYVSYTQDGAAPETRPVMFAFNGGPGSATIWLHMGTIGPRRVGLAPDGALPKPPFKLEDNEDSWLRGADVVLVDAPGTGFSRVPKAEDGAKFYSQQGDIRAFTEFIRLYLTRNKRWGSPLFVAGESYGGLRVAGLANSLTGAGIGVNGIVVISGTFNFQALDANKGNDLPYISFLPSFTATALYHKKLSPEMQSNFDLTIKKAEEFAMGDYATALLKGTSMSEAEENAVIKRYAELTGLSETFVRQARLRVSEFQFFKELLREGGKTVGRLDSRFTASDEVDTGGGPESDASEQNSPAFVSCLNDYFTRELNYITDQRYRTYGGGRFEFAEGRYADTSDDLRQALRDNPHLKVLITCGYYDLACPYFGIQFNVNHMGLRRDQLSNISYQYYHAGHMMYIDAKERTKLADDVYKFIEESR